MTTNPSQPFRSASQWHGRKQWICITLACLVSFALGFWLSDRRQAGLVDEETSRRVGEFVKFCDRLGVLDRARLDEALIIAKESEWEDRDAEECTNQTTPEVAIPAE